MPNQWLPGLPLRVLGHDARVTNFEVVIGHGDGDPIKVLLDSHDAEQAEALYEELRGRIEEAQRVKAPAVDLSGLAASAAGITVDPAEVTSIDLLDADEDPSPGQHGPTADYGEG